MRVSISSNDLQMCISLTCAKGSCYGWWDPQSFNVFLTLFTSNSHRSAVSYAGKLSNTCQKQISCKLIKKSFFINFSLIYLNYVLWLY